MKSVERNGLVYSFVIHFAVFCILYLGAPDFIKDAPKERVIAVEVMKISDITNIPNRAKSKKQSAQKDSPASPSDHKETTVKQTEEVPVPAPDKKPDPSKEEKAPQDKKKSEPSKDKKNKENRSQADKKKPQAKKSDPFSDPSFMKTLEESAKKSRPSDELQDILQELESESDKPYNPDMELSISEKDLIVSTIQTQIHKSWYNNGLDTKDLKVILRITFDIDGNVLRVDPQHQKNSSPLYPSFVENAIRATKIASPIMNLPKDKFSSWENVELEFDPSDAIL